MEIRIFILAPPRSSRGWKPPSTTSSRPISASTSLSAGRRPLRIISKTRGHAVSGWFSDPRGVMSRMVRSNGLVEARAQLDGAQAEHGGGLEDLGAHQVGVAAALAVGEPVEEELELHVLDAVAVQDAPHLRQTDPGGRVDPVRVVEAEALVAGARGRLDAVAERERERTG